MRVKDTIISLMLLLTATAAQGQITIGGNVYGGGNAGDTGGKTKVTVYAGDINSVYGGARMANVAGSAFVHIDGEHASDSILINKVYGGNDIAGTIGSSTTLPTELTDTTENKIKYTWNALVRTSTKTTTAGEEATDAKGIFIGQVYGGGNGEYDYDSNSSPYHGKVKPELAKTYLEIKGGTIAHVYGGGNAATVTSNTTIYINNPSKVVTHITDANGVDILHDEAGTRLKEMGLNTTQTHATSASFQFARVFGGNNKADMAIRPKWNLERGLIRDLYGGGNEGRMTSPEGLLLQIEGAGMTVDNVYGGCRRADVRPLYNNNDATPVPYDQIQLDPSDNPNHIPGGYAARVRVLKGHVNNVYGGNDISGNVYGGNTVGIFTRIYGNVYGGGNGSYAYTDNPLLKDDPQWCDFYYSPKDILNLSGDTFDGLQSAEALNIFRPNAEKVSLLVRGTQTNPVIVDGALYVGGNSASLRQQTTTTGGNNRQTHIKIGSYVTIDNVFLGNNGENMVTDEILERYAGNVTIGTTNYDFSQMQLTNSTQFDKYMEGCAMKVKPTVVFESRANGDNDDYVHYSTKFGSFYCGGNVGSILVDGKITVDFEDQVIIYDKVVGGCNNANVAAKPNVNAAYNGGMLGDADDDGTKVELNFSGLKIQPKRWNAAKTELVWNTIKASTGEEVNPTDLDTGTSDDDDIDRRLKGGNIYGGCYNSGHVNGNVVININESVVDRKGTYAIFDEIEENEGEAILYGKDSYNILTRHSGVILDEQGMDVLGRALNVFGGGYGQDSEIWGSTTINLNAGYVFQVFGGGEKGVVGKPNDGTGDAYTFNNKTFKYNPKYSCYVNLKGDYSGVYRGHAEDNPNMAEAEFIYGGAFEAPIVGNTMINLGDGRVFNTFAGSCNADILGHTETYIGREGVDTQGRDVTGFPWVRDHVYGGNDLGGQILGKENRIDRVNSSFQSAVYNPKNAQTPNVTDASAYMEYIQGRVSNIFGGCYGVYDYKDPHFKDYTYTTGGTGTTTENIGTARDGFIKPRLDNAFVNFKPITNARNAVTRIYGAGQGYSRDSDRDIMQKRSYILIDIPQTMEYFRNMEIFGAGDFCGLGMGVAISTANANADGVTASTVIDLMRGQISAAYGGSCNEGITRRTIVNVPASSTINIGNIFGGAYGTQILPPCDVYESNVNYKNTGENAVVTGAIYGGNYGERRTLYAKVNISSPVWSNKTDGKLARVFGAGKGLDTWSEYTEVNLESGAKVYEVYGGGEMGHVLCAESVQKYMQLYKDKPSAQIATDDPNWKKAERWTGEVGASDLQEAWKAAWLKDWKAAWTLGGDYYTPSDNTYTDYVSNSETNLANSALVRTAEMDDRDLSALSDEQKERVDHKYNTNVLIKEGATVEGYAYGGGLGKSITPLSGDVYGTTYIALLGGTVTKDLYAAGTSGGVYNLFGANNDEYFTASSNAFIKGGTARNVYGGGWEGSVGHHAGEISASTTGDILGETHVVIGMQNGTTLANGIPAIERNAYGGGEGGAVFGTSNITLNKGYIGYRYFADEPTDNTYPYIHDGSGYYQEKIVDETWKDNEGNFIPNTNLESSGNIFGGGYIDNSSVDFTNVTLYGGVVRNSAFGGGEIAAIGRGDVYGEDDTNPVRTLKGIYKAGKTHVYMYEGKVKRNVFGGGKGIDNLGRTGSLYTNGYVFGQTEVNIFGGEIGTDEGVALGYGNVFGGGDIGYVYSAFEYPDGTLGFGKKSGERYDDGDEGYYFKHNGTSYTDDEGTALAANADKYMTEDSKVLVEPHARALSAVTINGHSYAAGDYVPTTDLNTLGNKNSGGWSSLDPTGIIIHNAVFAGGNVSSGNDQVYANATTLFGNATASIHDVYNRDLITVGTGHTGGLYGDGNLTFVDGYRGLNITNYGTDFYHITDDISLEVYEALTPREAAYYELKYKCVQECQDNELTTYSVNSTLAQEELIALFAGQTNIVSADGTINPAYWVKNGVVSRYAGRIMNTIQRADFCGVFGSRMVMKGAQDRVPEIVDYTNYTINRVREVSLNQQRFIPNDDSNIHGNYFGIYNIVNFLGALTSDVHFKDPDNQNEDVRQTESTEYPADGKTYYQWKADHINDRSRNNGSSLNKVALASGVYLELTTEKSTGNGLREKDWGYITGVVELDLINVQTGVGGGFVYAKNVHGKQTYHQNSHNTLTALNADAVTRKDFTYSTSEADQKEWQTSGNFVHSTQTIVDDCYDESGKYKGGDAVPAHYWYIKGQVYVYDQYVSAYTGAPNAYSETVNIPLTISAASHGVMKLLNVKPNRYAYYSTYNANVQKKLDSDGKLVINDVEYHLNDPISYWDWNLLTPSERNLFVEDTYVVIADSKIGETEYAEGTVLLKGEYDALIEDGKPTNVTQKKIVNDEETYVPVDFDYVFRSSNNLSHNTGYILTYNVNNPAVWNKYYSPLTGPSRDGKITVDEYKDLDVNAQAAYTDGPTYRPNANGLYGQRDYKYSDIITEEVYITYQDAQSAHPEAIPTSGQATFEPAYLVTSYLETTKKDGTEQRLQEGAKLAKSEYYDAEWSTMSSKVAAAYVCTSTITLSKTEFVYNGQLMTLAEKNQLKHDYEDLAADIEQYVVPAYYCSTAGRYGGDYYETTKNYRALTAFSSMSEEDRENFTFNYDALDLLIDPTYGGTEGQKYQYDGYTTSEGNEDNMIYSLEKPVDYTALYNGSDDSEYDLENGHEYSRSFYEALPNEQRYYAPINVASAGTYYVVHTPFIVGETPYSVGTVIESSTYGSLNDTDKAKVTTLTFTSYGSTYYYCREPYTGTATVTPAEGVTGGASYTSGEVPIGVVIDADCYGDLPNKQKNFTIHGVIPVETTTLYVSRNSDIFDLSKEKIITVIYEYNYEESDVSGLHITPVSERHIVNIHLQFKSGIPTVEDITKPGIVLPGTAVTLRTPNVVPGAYEVTGGGWELYERIDNAESHTNGIDYTPGSDPLYWYQDGYYVAYYAQTYLGKTYSNHVPVTVANYHDLKKVMDDKDHHLYVDYDLNRLKRECKIYINDPEEGLNQLKSFIDLSYNNTSKPEGHASLEDHVKGGADLEFFLHSDIEQTGEWTPIANGENECFEGNFHGDGYTISGLSNSLFDKLCGNVFNLGVTGSFTGAGVAEKGNGYVENCWISTSSTAAKTSKPVFGTPTGLTSERPYRIVNCYYQEEDNATNKYTNHPSTSTYGIPTRKNAQAFYNGTVAYDLNGFYLYKRYCDHEVSTGTENKFFKVKTDGTLTDLQTKYYGSNADLCSAGYVEARYADGDFRYADGEIPNTTEDRLYTELDADNNTIVKFAPIWPDDYIYFGQTLNFDYGGTHQDLPTHISKSEGRLPQTTGSNRVYRAPAYYQSQVMSMAHFNPAVNLTAYSKPKTVTDKDLKPAYPNMTAIDFKGYNDANYTLGGTGELFYRPILDDDGIVSIVNNDETPNLLVYAPSAEANQKTYSVLTDYFADEPVYSDYDETSANYTDGKEYKRVAKVNSSGVLGHLVTATLTNNKPTAANDHLLVDKRDFNCPISYTFGNGKRMWYQRIPDRFVDTSKGWETASLPFTAELITTQQKGEITHFYSKSKTVDGETKTGHEYWLREYKGEKEQSADPNIFIAAFNYPDASGSNRTVGNTFLWDYYYSANERKDANQDLYQRYYETARNFENYPLLAKGTPYIVGFPGKTYYEFDLSGEWTPKNTFGMPPAQLEKQYISFVSAPGITIGISDTEQTDVTEEGYTFKANYMSKAITGYLLNTVGNSFEKTTEPTATIPFRPYFVTSTAGSRKAAKSILFDSDGSSFAIGDKDPSEEKIGDESMLITVHKHDVSVTSSLRNATDVRIFNVSGVAIASYTIQPGETVTTFVPVGGVYIVRAAGGRYQKKLAVR